MSLTVTYTEENNDQGKIVLPGKVRLVILKTKQVFCNHDWKYNRTIELFNNHSLKVQKCCKCKKKNIKRLK